jgi:hypothetical protein
MNPEPQVTQEAQIAPAQNDTAATAVATPSVETVETDKDINWKKFREQRELDRKAREAAEKMAAEERARSEATIAAMNSLLSKNQPPQQAYEQVDESQDEFISKRVDAILAKKEAQAARERAERDIKELPERLQANLPDFHQVCKSDNLDYLEYHYPEVAVPFKHMVEGYEKWQAIYRAVKRFVPNTDVQKEIRKADLNSQKPQSMSSPGTSQATNNTPAVKLDEGKRAANWARMQKVMNQLT